MPFLRIILSLKCILKCALYHPSKLWNIHMGFYLWKILCWLSFIFLFFLFLLLLLTFFFKNYLKISSPHSTLFMELFVIVCAFSCLLSSLGFLLISVVLIKSIVPGGCIFSWVGKKDAGLVQLCASDHIHL